MKKNIKYGYMCETDFTWELGEVLKGTVIYSSLEDLKNCRKCVHLNPLSDSKGNDTKDLSQCGIIKVKIELDRVVQKPKVIWNKKNK